jgi:hypothetical protein
MNHLLPASLKCVVEAVQILLTMTIQSKHCHARESPVKQPAVVTGIQGIARDRIQGGTRTLMTRICACLGECACTYFPRAARTDVWPEYAAFQSMHRLSRGGIGLWSYVPPLTATRSTKCSQQTQTTMHRVSHCSSARSVRLRVGVRRAGQHERVPMSATALPNLKYTAARMAAISGVAPQKVLWAHGSMQAIHKPVGRLVESSS